MVPRYSSKERRVYREFVAICDGDMTGALLLDVLRDWHEKTGELSFYEPIDSFRRELLGAATKKQVRDALGRLIGRGYIKRYRPAGSFSPVRVTEIDVEAIKRAFRRHGIQAGETAKHCNYYTSRRSDNGSS